VGDERLSGGDGAARRKRSVQSAIELRRSDLRFRHICIVTETYPPEVNGVALTLGHLVKGLLTQGHTVSVIRPYQRATDGSDQLDDCRVTLVGGLPLPGYEGLQFGLPAGRLLRRTWRQRPPDVVYVATEGPLGWSAVRIARCLRIPIVSGFHTNYHNYSMHYRLGWMQSVIFRYLRRFHNHTAGTLVPSVDLRDRLQQWGFNNVNVLDRGVDSRLFAPERRCRGLRRQWGVSDSDIAVLHVGRVAPEKNLNLAISAYRAMKRSGLSMKFILVGDGPCRAALQKENPDLVFQGMQTGEQLAMHYASADMFLFPSETETFGNVTLEAMASGLGVIAYDYAAAKMHIHHGDNGLLIPYGDRESFVDAAVRLVRAPDYLATIRSRARKHIVAYDWPRVVERFEKLLMGARLRSLAATQGPIVRPGLAN
jgi:glycosyltransferase involved in cell wall biosynthesis